MRPPYAVTIRLTHHSQSHGRTFTHGPGTIDSSVLLLSAEITPNQPDFLLRWTRGRICNPITHSVSTQVGPVRAPSPANGPRKSEPEITHTYKYTYYD
jgi:hypothetical protein